MPDVRVLRVIARLNMGGPAYHVSLLSGRLTERGFRTRLLHGNVAAGEGSLEAVAARYGAAPERVDALAPDIDPRRDARALSQLVHVVRGWRPDIVHTHTAKAGMLGRLAALTVRPRPIVLHTFHGHVLEAYFGRARSELYRQLERALALVSDRLIGVSQATVDDLVRLRVAPRDKFAVVPIGLDLEPFATDLAAERAGYRAALGLREDDLLLSFVGRLVPIKRVDVLIEGIAAVRALGVQAHLALVGDGALRPSLEQQASRLGISGFVHFLGYRDDMPTVVAGADVAVLTSDNEGTPVSLIEAAAGGRPAIATDVGGVRDVVRPASGRLVPRADPAAFAAAVREIVAADDRARMGRAAQEWVLTRYSADRLVDDVEALYRELLAGRGRPGEASPSR